MSPLAVQFISVLAPLVLALLVALAGYGIAYLERKTKSERLRGIEDSLLRGATTAVASIAQTRVDQLKVNNGGALTPAQSVELKAEAVEAVKQIVGAPDLALLTKAKGATAVAATLDHTVEAAVRDTKALPPSSTKLADLTLAEAEAVVDKEVKK